MSGGPRLADPRRWLHSAVWLIGLVILSWKRWWWPGLLVLVTISLILEVVFQFALPQPITTEAEPENGGTIDEQGG
jgi:hypothetical protein